MNKHTMTKKAINRLVVIEEILKKHMTVVEAAKKLEISVRHTFRLIKRFKEEGVESLIHKNTGRKPKHAVKDEIKEEVIKLACREFAGANFTHFSELLKEFHGIQLSPKSIARILKNAGLCESKYHSPPRRYRRRKRRSLEGELIQMDASPFAWLEDRGPVMSLHGAIDDATGKILGLYFRPTEDTIGYLHVLRQVLEHGIPVSFYTDRSTIFVSNKSEKLTLEEQLEGKTKARTQFGKVIEELGISHIEALSPQAKGRIERLWGTLQDRLVIEMRLAQIKNIEEANEFLKEFIPRFNSRFAIPAEGSVFRKVDPGLDLNMVLSFREQRKGLSDSTISIGGILYSLTDELGRRIGFRAKTLVEVRTHLDGNMTALVEGKRYSLVPWVKRPNQNAARDAEVGRKERPRYKPDKAHPWRRFSINPVYSQMFYQGVVGKKKEDLLRRGREIGMGRGKEQELVIPSSHR